MKGKGARTGAWLLLVLPAVMFVAACGSSPRDPAAALGIAASKALAMRATTLGDLETIADAAALVQSADDAIETGGNDADVIVARAAADIAVAAPIVARARTDVVQYVRALSVVHTADAKTSPAERSAAEALVAAGEREGAAIRLTAADYATQWPLLSQLSTAQRTWVARTSDGSTPGMDVGYAPTAQQLELQLAPGRAAIAHDESDRRPATDACVATIARLGRALPPARLDLPPPPSPYLPDPPPSSSSVPPAQ